MIVIKNTKKVSLPICIWELTFVAITAIVSKSSVFKNVQLKNKMFNDLCT